MKIGIYGKIITKFLSIAAASMLAAGFLFSSLPVQAQTAQVIISLKARNLNQAGPSYWSNSIQADPLDRIEFSIQIRSTGISPLYNARVSTSLSGTMRYILGSTRVNGLQANEGITDTYGYGLNLETLAAGETKTITFQADILDGSYFYGGSGTLTPYAYVKADNLTNFYQDKVDIIVGGTVMGVTTEPDSNNTVTYSNNFYPLMYIEERGANISRDASSYAYTTYAAPGETVEFTIKVKSDSLGTLSNIWVSDRLPSEMSYISHSTAIENAATVDGIANDGISIGALTPGQTKTVKFRARILPRNLTSGEVLSLANYASARNSGTQTSVEADALVIISKDKSSALAGPISSPPASTPSPFPAPNQTAASTGEVLGAATVKTGPSGTFILATLTSFFISSFIYYKWRKDRIFNPFQFWQNWRLKRTLRRLKKEE